MDLTRFTKEENFIYARESLREGELKNAEGHYFMLHEKDPENAEAEFFSAYMSFNSFVEKKDYESAGNAFKAMTKSLKTAVKCIKDAECDGDENMFVLSKLVEIYTPIARFPFDKRIHSCPFFDGISALFALGDAIENEYKSDPRAMKLAIELWKEAVSFYTTYQPSALNSIKPENYAEKIKQLDPTYNIPTILTMKKKVGEIGGLVKGLFNKKG